MKKYSKKMINDYILGNDLEDYSVDELEDDMEFMMLVIDDTNDEKLYNLCSDRLKKDYEFVKYLINKFRNNLDFICVVADYYLFNVDDEFSRIELCILMMELTVQNKEKNMEYTVALDTVYMAKRVEIEIVKLGLNDDILRDIGMGFLILFDSFNSSEIILNYFAKKTIKEILDENDIDLDELLHEQFKTPEQIDKIGINNYMLNFIRYYDSTLSSYLCTHIDLMSFLREKIELIQKKWTKSILDSERKKYNIIFGNIHNYMVENGVNTFFSETDMLYYAGKELGVLDKILKYSGLSEDSYKMIIDGLDDELFEDALRISSDDMNCYNKIKAIIFSVLNDTTQSDSDNSHKILKFPKKGTS